MADLNKSFIVNLQGKDFVTYNGLVDLAHQMKLKSITTEIIQLPTEENGDQCIIKAVATTEDGKAFEGYGDADPGNVNRMIAKHLIRMAETRAKARALRDLTNVGMTAIEELGGDDEAEKQAPTKKKAKEPTADNKYNELLTELYSIVKQKKYEKSIKGYIKKAYNKESSTELTEKEIVELIAMLNSIGE